MRRTGEQRTRPGCGTSSPPPSTASSTVRAASPSRRACAPSPASSATSSSAVSSTASRSGTSSAGSSARSRATRCWSKVRVASDEEELSKSEQTTRAQRRANNRDERDVGTSAHAQPPGRRGGKAPTPPAFHQIDRGTHPDGVAAGGLRMSEAFLHRPVMVDEVVELMRTVPPGVVVDATVGAGGHARALLEARSDLRLVGLDRDGDAVDAATEALAGFAGRVVLRRARFDEITTTLQELGHETGTRGDISGALFDLGVSSPQLDRPERGFSYRGRATRHAHGPPPVPHRGRRRQRLRRSGALPRAVRARRRALRPPPRPRSWPPARSPRPGSWSS